MSKDGPNLRRYYLDGLSDLKHEMAMFEYLLARHHPRLSKHLQHRCIPSVLYVSQWLLTIFACPFPAFFTAQIIDILLLEDSDRIVMQMCLAIMAEVEERLLRMDDFEDIVTCLKMDPATWSDDKLRGLLTAAYLSSVSEDEIQLARKAVTAESLHAIRSTDEIVQSAAGHDRSGCPTSEVDVVDAPVASVGSGSNVAQSRLEGIENMQTLGAIDDLMKHELEQLTWAGPSGGEERVSNDVQDPHTLLRLSGDTSAPAHSEAGNATSGQPVDATGSAFCTDIGTSLRSEVPSIPEDAASTPPEQTSDAAR